MDFKTKLDKAISKSSSLLCVGLDPDPQKLKKSESQFQFNKIIIEATAAFVCAYKPNIGFYEAVGLTGLEDLKNTIFFLKKNYPLIPVILDAKRADIGNTTLSLAEAIFDFYQADAVTANPYMGFDSLEPFLKRRDRGVIVLCHTSNPSSADFQELSVNGQPLYIKVAQKVVQWNKKYKNLLMVVGATNPTQIKRIRRVAGDMTFLVPGIGVQSGNLEKICQNGLLKNGRGLVISASRSIIYAQDPAMEAQNLKNEINKYRQG
ncbi:MAG: orotidine-5'-phosphate decarboxylase [Candidatus Curtissbacteria bacterium]|nr:orotidine-5'-phosphate decarboxylase [Candidatus Curtissbacteria bacterium]